MPKVGPAPEIPNRIAEHGLRLEGDILHIEIVGNLDLKLMKQLVPVYRECIAHFGYLMLLMGVSQSTGFEPAARRYSVEWAKDFASVQASAVYGAPAIVRGFMTIVNRAIFLLSKGTATELSFVSSAAEGRAWLNSRRDKLHQAASKPGTGQ